jgi:hypothetical protein
LYEGEHTGGGRGGEKKLYQVMIKWTKENNISHKSMTLKENMMNY